MAEPRAHEFVALDQALERLAGWNFRQARITVEKTAWLHSQIAP